MLFEKQPHFKLDHILPIRAISQLIFNSRYFHTQKLTPLQAEKDMEKHGVLADSISEEPGYAVEAYGGPHVTNFGSSPNEQRSHQLKKKWGFFSPLQWRNKKK